jgi:cell division septation protein DedD
MAAGTRRKRFSIKFELSPAGLLGLGIVCFCIFLWMFLLGVWAGQTILTTGSFQIAESIKSRAVPPETPGGREQVQELSPAVKPAVKVPVPAGRIAALSSAAKREMGEQSSPALAGENESAFFAVQIGAFQDKAHAEKTLREWRAKGYQPFSRSPEGPDDRYTRVYVGRFSQVAEARELAAKLEQKEKLKPFIATIPAGSGNRP